MQQSSTTHHRYKQLDSLRGLAALAVFAGHAIGGVFGLPLVFKILATPFSIFINGNAAVMFFFVLSGFVLSLLYMDSQRPLSITAFYVKRIFRIYPAFIVAIVLAVVLKELVFQQNVHANGGLWLKQYWLWKMNGLNLKELLRTLTLIAPQIDFKLIDPPIWSLTVEMIMAFYVPFFILIVSRCNVLVNVVIALLLSYLSYRFHTYVILHCNVFYLGVMLAKYRIDFVSAVSRWSIVVKIAFALLGLTLYNAGMQFLDLRTSVRYSIFIYDLPAIGSAIIIVSVLGSKRLSRFFEHKPFVFLGIISYSFYLMHFPLLLTLSSIITNNAYLVVVSAFGLTIGISYLMMRFMERPFQSLGSSLVKKYRLLNTGKIKIS